ncbi:MAG TPA: TolC family protein [Vicinamibacterales bacterium]
MKSASFAAIAAALAVLSALPVRAQIPSIGAAPPPRPMQTQPTATQGTANPFLGGVPTGTPTAEPLKLTVIDAILRALDHNLGVLNAEEALGRAHGARWIALSQLLPNVNGRVSEARQIINLAAFGFGSGTGPAGLTGFPELVGPFNVFDARVFISQSIFDLEAINDAKSEGHSLDAARFSRQSARDFVIHVAGNVYIQALAASARSDASRAQRDTAEALYKQALSLKESGIIPGVDVLRAQVQFNSQQQRATAAANDFEKMKLTLARIIGLPLGQAFSLDGTLPQLPSPGTSLDDVVERAYRTRPDYQAALAKVRAAEASRAAIVGSALPSVHVNADLGGIGLTVGDAKYTYSLVGAVSVPIFNGNRTHGRLAQADADIKVRQAEAEDLKASIYYEVRTAFLDLDATSQQLAVATSARELADQQLQQVRDRFTAGVASNVEVIQAQEAVALAVEQLISAQYGFALANGALIRGVGSSEDTLRQLIGGGR